MKKYFPYPLGLKILFNFSCASIVLTPFNDNLRYIKYFLVIPAFIFFIYDYKRISNNYLNIKLNKYLSSYLYLYLFMVLFSFMVLTFRNDYYLRFFAEAFFILSPAFLVYLFFRLGYLVKIDSIMNFYFLSYCISYVLSYGTYIFQILIHPTYLLQAFITSNIPTESTLCYLFGMFTLYYLHKKDKTKTSIAFIFTIISFKRIAILALFLCVLFDLIFAAKKSQKLIKLFKYLGILANMLYILVIYLFAHGAFDLLISNLTGVSANSFTKGRKILYESIFIHLKPDLILGTGLGKTSEFLEHFIIKVNLLHSDVLKVFLEFGLINFVLWLITLFKLNTKSKDMFVVFIFLNIIFLTDNSFIYFNVAFMFYLIQCSNIIKEYYKQNYAPLKV